MRLSVLYISSIVLVSLIGIAALSGTRLKTQQDAPLQITNRTQAFSVIKAERGANEFSITLRNNSTKTVTAFSIAPSKGFTIVEEFVLAEISDIGIRPNALFSKSYPSLTSIQPQTIEVKAIIFDDGTAEGDTSSVRQIEDSRLGQQIQIRRAVKELQTFVAKGLGDVSEFKKSLSSALSSSDADTLNILAELKPSRATRQQPLSEDLREDLDNGRQNVLRRLAEAEANGSSGFLQVKETYERILARGPN